MPFSHAYHAGNLVDGACSLALFGDVATEVCTRTDGDEGLFASYSDVQFQAPVRAGDVVEVGAVVERVGTRSRTIRFEARVICRGRPDVGESAAEVFGERVSDVCSGCPCTALDRCCGGRCFHRRQSPSRRLRYRGLRCE